MMSSPGIGWQHWAKLSTPRSLPVIMMRSVGEADSGASGSSS